MYVFVRSMKMVEKCVAAEEKCDSCFVCVAPLLLSLVSYIFTAATINDSERSWRRKAIPLCYRPYLGAEAHARNLLMPTGTLASCGRVACLYSIASTPARHFAGPISRDRYLYLRGVT